MLRIFAAPHLYVRVIRDFYCLGVASYAKNSKQYLCALQGCFLPQGALILLVLV